MIKIIYPGFLPDLNRYIKALNSNRFAGNTMKQKASGDVATVSKKHRNHVLLPPFFIHFHWVCKDKKIDKDNIAFAKKFILDGLQTSEVLPQDNWKGVEGFKDTFDVDKTNPRIEITIYGSNEKGFEKAREEGQ